MIAAASPAAAENWRMTGFGGEAPDRTVYLVDLDSISRIGNTIRFRTSTIWEAASSSNDFNLTLTQREGNCAKMASGVTVNEYYLDAELIDKDEEPTGQNVHSPESLIYATLAAACGDESYFESETLTDPEATVRAWLRDNFE